MLVGHHRDGILCWTHNVGAGGIARWCRLVNRGVWHAENHLRSDDETPEVVSLDFPRFGENADARHIARASFQLRSKREARLRTPAVIRPPDDAAAGV